MRSRLCPFALLVLAAVLSCRCDENDPWNPTVPPQDYAAYPTWSPDGNTVFYQGEDGLRLAIWASDMEGNTSCVTPGWHQDAFLPDVSPDGNWLLFGSGTHVFKARLLPVGTIDTTAVVPLTVRGRNFFPRWSPDGTRIVYDSNVKGDSFSYYGICLMDSNGANKCRLPDTGGDARSPAWSSDGAQVVFVGYIGHGGGELLVRDTGGAFRRALTCDSVDDRAPDWSPDGTRIALTREYRASYSEKGTSFSYWRSYVCTVDTAGRKITRLTPGHSPRWSPEGKRLAFVGSSRLCVGDFGSFA